MKITLEINGWKFERVSITDDEKELAISLDRVKNMGEFILGVLPKEIYGEPREMEANGEKLTKIK